MHKQHVAYVHSLLGCYRLQSTYTSIVIRVLVEHD